MQVTTVEEAKDVLENGELQDKLVLVNNPYPAVRRVCAEYGYGLDQLVHDVDPDVRIAVAKRGYGLEALFNDPSIMVQYAVSDIKGTGFSILPELTDSVSFITKGVYTLVRYLNTVKKGKEKSSIKPAQVTIVNFKRDTRQQEATYSVEGINNRFIFKEELRFKGIDVSLYEEQKLKREIKERT